MARSRIPPHLPGAESDLASLQAGAAASAPSPILEARVARDDLLGEIDIDRMERVMNSEVDALRANGSAFLQPHMLVDHFTRNSPQAILMFMRERLDSNGVTRFVAAVREVMYEPGQTVVPQGYAVHITEAGTVRLVAVAVT